MYESFAAIVIGRLRNPRNEDSATEIRNRGCEEKRKDCVDLKMRARLKQWNETRLVGLAMKKGAQPAKEPSVSPARDRFIPKLFVNRNMKCL
jgi:hypothetical protein